MKKYRRIVWGIVLVLALVLPAATALAGDTPEFPLEMEGTLHGAAYKILVPADWNGTLLVYAHGYTMDPITEPDAALFGDPSEALLLANGYALAASGYRNTGWNVDEGIKDTQRLTLFFQQQVAKPTRTILVGVSMGTVVTLKSMERYHGIYDGAIPLCSVAMGSSRNADLKLDAAVAYAAAFGWPDDWGEIGDVRDDIDGFTTVLPKVMTELAHPANFPLFEFGRLVNDMPMGGYYGGNGWLPPGVVLNTLFSVQMRAEIEARAGGPAAQNADHVYSLSGDDRAYLNSIGLADAEVDELLAEMNAIANIKARRSARQYLVRYADFRGFIKDPVLMVHNIEDPMTLVQGTNLYHDAVAATGNEDLLVRTYTTRIGHCNFTSEQLLALVTVMEGWLETGTPPTADAFPASLEFDHSYEPAPYPQPPAE